MGLISKNGDTISAPRVDSPTTTTEAAPVVKQVSERERSIILQCALKIVGPAMTHYAGGPTEWFDLTVKMGRVLAEEIMK